MKIALVVFDMAGTTVHDDDTVHICLKQALEAAGVEVTRDQINEVMGEPKPVAIAKLLSRVRERQADTSDQDVIEIHERFETLMLTHYREAPGVRAVEGAADVFRELKDSDVRVALDTGFSRAIVDAILERLGWLGNELLDATVASDEVRRGRPHADLIERAMRLTEVDNPKSVAKVGDTPADLLSGAAAGCGWIVGITTGSHTRGQLERYPHTHLIERLEELPVAVLGVNTVSG
jgi:phosphonatase-like hydrolase